MTSSENSSGSVQHHPLTFPTQLQQLPQEKCQESRIRIHSVLGFAVKVSDMMIPRCNSVFHVSIHLDHPF